MLTAEEHTFPQKGMLMMDPRILWIRGGRPAIALLIAVGCATPPPPPPPPPPAATADTSERSFDEAVQVATDGLMSQLQARSDPSAKPGAKRGVVIDPMVDAMSGQQTAATRLLEQRVGERLQSNPQFEVMPFQVASLSKAQYLLTGTMTRIASAQTGARQVFQIDLAATDLKTGIVTAQASSRARDEALDTNPTPYYRDSPVVVKDKVIDGYIATSKTAPGQPADSVYFERVSTATVISEATAAYNSDNYQDALSLYRSAETTASASSCASSTGSISPRGSSVARPRRRVTRSTGRRARLSNNNPAKFNPNSTDFGPIHKSAGCTVSGSGRSRSRRRDEGVHERDRPHQPHRHRAEPRPPSPRRDLHQALSRQGGSELTRRTQASGMGFRENPGHRDRRRVTLSTGGWSSRSPTADVEHRPGPAGAVASGGGLGGRPGPQPVECRLLMSTPFAGVVRVAHRRRATPPQAAPTDQAPRPYRFVLRAIVACATPR